MTKSPSKASDHGGPSEATGVSPPNDYNDAIGRALERWIVQGFVAQEVHPDDLHRWRPHSEAAARYQAMAIWNGWEQRIAQGKEHPKGIYLALFLRGWIEVGGGWLPDGMAKYLADRFDPDVSFSMRGRLPGLASDREARREKQVGIAAEVLRHAGYPECVEILETGDIKAPPITSQDHPAVVAAAAAIEGCHPVDALKAYRRHLGEAVLHLLFGPAASE